MTITSKNRPTSALPGPLRRYPNRLAHQAGLATEARLRAAWTAHLEQAAKAGATRAELATLLSSAAAQINH